MRISVEAVPAFEAVSAVEPAPKPEPEIVPVIPTKARVRKMRLDLGLLRPARVLGKFKVMSRVLPSALMLFAAPAWAGDIVGRASVIDGDTIEIHGQRIRLHGIDAPESRQLCTDKAGEIFRCGQAAVAAQGSLL